MSDEHKGFFYEDSLLAPSRRHELQWRIKHGGNRQAYYDVMTRRKSFEAHKAEMISKCIECADPIPGFTLPAKPDKD